MAFEGSVENTKVQSNSRVVGEGMNDPEELRTLKPPVSVSSTKASLESTCMPISVHHESRAVNLSLSVMSPPRCHRGKCKVRSPAGLRSLFKNRNQTGWFDPSSL